MRPVCQKCSTAFDRDPKNPVSLYCPPCRISVQRQAGLKKAARVTETVTVPCNRCGAAFGRRRKGPQTAHCRPCRIVLKRDRNRIRMAETRRHVDDALHEELHGLADREHAYRVAATMLPPDRTVADRMPAGSTTPLGSDDGRSTFFKSLAEELDGLASASVRHTCRDTADKFAHHTEGDCGGCFWEREPHWHVDL